MPPRHARAHRAPPERGRGDPESPTRPQPPLLSPARPERGRVEEPRCGHRSAAMCSPLRHCYFHQHRLPGQPPCPSPCWGASAGVSEPAALSARPRDTGCLPQLPDACRGSPLAWDPVRRGVWDMGCDQPAATGGRRPPQSPLGAGGERL